MGILSSLCSAVKSAFSSVAKAVSSVLQNSPLLQKLMPILGVTIPPPLDIIAVVAIEVISACMGKPEKPEELGWQMNKAEKKPEDFDSFEEYRAYLNEEYPFDKEAFDAQTDEEKAACRYVGMAGTMQELKESKGFDLNANSLGVLVGAASTLGWSNDTMKNFAQGMLNTLGGPGFNLLADYAKGNLSAEDGNMMDNALDKGIAEAGITDSREGISRAMGETIDNF